MSDAAKTTTSIFAFATDLNDEGIEAVLDNIQHRAGLEGVSIAVAYHHGRDVFPHNPVRKVRFLEGGKVFFRPDPERYSGLRLRPQISDLATEVDILAEVVRAATRRGMSVHAWTVFLHNYLLGALHPTSVVQNAFGNPYLTDLCPANPDVRAYVVALVGDIARYGVQTIMAESLHYHGIEHGFHHERYFIDLGPRARYLLGLCFCSHCVERAGQQGVDGPALREHVRRELERALGGDAAQSQAEITYEEIADIGSGEMAGYLGARSQTVLSLADEATKAASAGQTRFSFLDLSGGVKGYATGKPTGEPAPAIAWRFGADLAKLAKTCHEIEMVGYAFDPDRIATDLQAYRSHGVTGLGAAIALRPMLPDCDSPENLAQKVTLARDHGLGRIDFYHYGFMRLKTLDLVREAIQSSARNS